MLVHIIFMAIIIALIVMSVLGYKKASKVSIYRYRNIAYAAMVPCLSIVLLLQIREMIIMRGGQVSFISFILNLPENFAMVSVFSFAVLCLAMIISNVFLIKHEGLKLKNTVGTIVIGIGILGTVGIYAVVYFLDRKGILNSANIVVYYVCNIIPFFLYCIIDYFECVMVGIMVLGYLAARQVPKYDKDFIIIPGCSIKKNGGLLPLLKGRVNRAIKYAWQQEIESGKPVKFIPSGGQGKDEIMSEGSAMEMYLLSHAAEENEIYAEKESKNTRENFVFSKKIADSQIPNANIAFSTTNYHMLRCGIIARKAGIEAEGIASSTKWYFWPNGFAREMVAIIVMTKKHHIKMVALMGLLSIILTILSRL